ncbi:hypothetical protein QL285_062632 [Trifolium repens]|nr:hypothetical protein QL285_062632 [Trifolium repens]
MQLAKMFLHLQENPHSDDSISDDDEHQPNLPNNVLSFQHISTNKQDELPLPARLDLLKGRFCNQNSSSLFQKSLEDEEVEMPDFNEGGLRDVSGEVVADSGDEDTVSEDEGSTILSPRLLQKYGPQYVKNGEVKDAKRKSEALLCFKESASCSASHATCSKANSSGIWSKAKPSFSLKSVTHKYGHIGSSISNIDRLPQIMKAVDHRASASLAENQLEDDDIVELELDTEPSETEALPHEFNLPLMADLFDNLQDKTDLYPQENQRKGKTVQPFQKNSRSHLPETVVDSEDSPEPVDSGSSSDHEESDKHMKITFPRKKMQTMADRFHDALGSSSVIAENIGALNSLRTGIFEKLQQVMQKEKERDIDFSKKLQAGTRPDGEFGCVDVNIISRYLDGKLIVCHCSFSKYTENSLLQAEGMGFDGSKGGQRTIIFSPRVCDNVDLEVGSLIRIHPPWKEVQVGNDIIILCSYFSEISSPF